ncbi:MAG: hypothetical protein VYC39_00060 [Myxococcota bacterium]|nr:hypothetical protein [Myxococcota bacterium]
MKTSNTHSLVATSNELASEKIVSVSLQGECLPNETVSNFHARQIHYISEAFFSADTSPMDSKQLEWLVREYCDFMSRAPTKQRFLFRTAVTVIAFLSPLFIWKLGPFSTLSFNQRIRALRQFEQRKIGRILIPVRAILCLIYYEHPEAAKTLGLATERQPLTQLGRK